MVKDERFVSKVEGKTNFSKQLQELSGTGIVECLEIIDVGCNLKQFDGLTRLTLTRIFYDRSTPLKKKTVGGNASTLKVGRRRYLSYRLQHTSEQHAGMNVHDVQAHFNDSFFFIYCMLFCSLYVQLLYFSFTVICAVYFVYLFFSFTVLCVDCVFYCLLPSGVLNK